MRMIFSTVRGAHDPALTVGSLAMTATGRPPIVPIPLATPSAPRPSCSQPARRLAAPRSLLPAAHQAPLGERPAAEQPSHALAHVQFPRLEALPRLARGSARQ